MFITPVSDNKASVFSLEYFSQVIGVENLPADTCRVFDKSRVNVTGGVCVCVGGALKSK